MIVGPGGAGKSTLAIRLGEALSLPVVHIDRLFWLSGWRRLATELQVPTLDEHLKGSRWIMEGDHVWTQPYRFAFADTVVFMDVPRGRCLRRVVGRALRHRGRNRPGMADGCPERINWALLLWVWRYQNVERPEVLRHLAALGPEKRVVVLRNDADAEAVLNQARSVWAKSSPT